MSRDSEIKNVLRTWFPKPTPISIPISIDDPLIIKYRMTVGSIYYNSKKEQIVINLPKDPQTEGLSLTIDFLRTYYPRVLNHWQVIKEKTEHHLEHIANSMLIDLISAVDDIISTLKTKYPSLVSYDGSTTQENFYVRDNIIECFYKEIGHIALTGNEIGLFQLNLSMGKVGNGFLFIKSSNEEVLLQFMALICKAIHSEYLINEFRNAEIQKAEVESEVLDFKQELQNIIIQLP